jgi:hypothetical protein
VLAKTFFSPTTKSLRRVSSVPWLVRNTDWYLPEKARPKLSSSMLEERMMIG